MLLQAEEPWQHLLSRKGNLWLNCSRPGQMLKACNVPYWQAETIRAQVSLFPSNFHPELESGFTSLAQGFSRTHSPSVLHWVTSNLIFSAKQTGDWEHEGRWWWPQTGQASISWRSLVTLPPRSQTPLPPMPHGDMRLIPGLPALRQGCSIGPTRIWLLAIKANKHLKSGAKPACKQQWGYQTNSSKQGCLHVSGASWVSTCFVFCFLLIFQYAAYYLILLPTVLVLQQTQKY